MTHDPPAGRQSSGSPGTENYRLGTYVFLMAGTMLFAGLIGGYLVLRYGAGAWPGPGMPRLPVRLAGFNTLVIALSSLALHRGVRALRLIQGALKLVRKHPREVVLAAATTALKNRAFRYKDLRRLTENAQPVPKQRSLLDVDETIRPMADYRLENL